jgi:hypothetical protein
MNEKVYEVGTKAAKTPIMLYYAKSNDNKLGIPVRQNDHQCSVNDDSTSIIFDLSGNFLQPFLKEVLTGFIGTRESDRLPAPF